jgi:predicted transcriptional regulator
MGKLTIKISDDVENRLREYMWEKWHGKGRHAGEVIEQALELYLSQQKKKEKE